MQQQHKLIGRQQPNSHRPHKNTCLAAIVRSSAKKTAGNVIVVAIVTMKSLSMFRVVQNADEQASSYATKEGASILGIAVLLYQ